MESKNTFILHETEAFMRGELDNVTVAHGRIVLDLVSGGHVPYGCYTSPAVPLPTFDALRVSWNAGTPAADFTSPLTPGYSDSLKGSGNLKYNEKKAKELWAKANAISPWTSDDKFTFAYNADGGHEVIYTAVVNSINNVLGAGVAATNPYPTFNDFRTAVSDRKVNGAFRSGWQPDYPSAENYLVQNFASAAADGNGSNDGDYKNPEFDALCDKAAASKSVADANKLYQQAQEVLLNDLPAVPLYYANAYGVASTGVSGFEMNWQNLPVYENMTKSGK